MKTGPGTIERLYQVTCLKCATKHAASHYSMEAFMEAIRCLGWATRKREWHCKDCKDA